MINIYTKHEQIMGFNRQQPPKQVKRLVETPTSEKLLNPADVVFGLRQPNYL